MEPSIWVVCRQSADGLSMDILWEHDTGDDHWFTVLLARRIRLLKSFPALLYLSEREANIAAGGVRNACRKNKPYATTLSALLEHKKKHDLMLVLDELFRRLHANPPDNQPQRDEKK